MMRWLTLFALVGCGGHVIYVFNGGVPVANGNCTDVTLTGDLQVTQKDAPDCAQATGFVVPERAAVAFWQVSAPTWAGPVSAPEANVEMEWVAPLESGQRDRALASGSSEKSLESGTREKALASGTSEKGLTSGNREKGLETGSREKGLESGNREKGLESGTREQRLESGSRAVEPLTLAKHGNGRATKDKPARFVLTATNVSDAPVSRIAVVDRVDRQLRVEADAGATTALPDGSTLVVFRSNETLGPHATRSFTMDVYAR